MQAEKTPANTKRRNWLLIATAVLALLTASGAAGKYWVIPYSARKSFVETIGHYWDGPIEIDRVEGGYFEPIRATGLTLRDRDGHVWARAKSVTLNYTPLPSISDQLGLADIDGLELVLHVNGSSCRPPVRNIPDFLRWLETQFSIKTFTVRNGAITTRYDGAVGGLWDGLEFTCQRQPDGCDYVMALARTGASGREGSCDGRVEVGIKAQWPDGGKLAYDGTLKLDGLDCAQLLAAVNVQAPIPLGTVRGEYAFSGGELTIETIRGQGELHVAAPLTGDGAPGEGDLGEVDFAVAGPVVTVRRTRMTLPVCTVRGEDAGRCDLDTGLIDMRLTSTPREGISRLIAFLPGRTGMLAGKTVDIHVTGRWNVPDPLHVEMVPRE